MPRISVRGVVKIDGKLLLLHRIKHGEEYWVVPGGGVEQGESYEETVVREMEEEVGIVVKPLKELVRVEFGDVEEYLGNRKIIDEKAIATIYLPGWSAMDIFYLCEYVSGEVGSGTGVEFAERSSVDNFYEIQAISAEELHSINIKPAEIKEVLLEFL